MVKLDVFVLDVRGNKDVSKIYLDQASAEIGINERFSEVEITGGEVQVVKISAVSYIREPKKA